MSVCLSVYSITVFTQNKSRPDPQHGSSMTASLSFSFSFFLFVFWYLGFGFLIWFGFLACGINIDVTLILVSEMSFHVSWMDAAPLEGVASSCEEEEKQLSPLHTWHGDCSSGGREVCPLGSLILPAFSAVGLVLFLSESHSPDVVRARNLV